MFILDIDFASSCFSQSYPKYLTTRRALCSCEIDLTDLRSLRSYSKYLMTRRRQGQLGVVTNIRIKSHSRIHVNMSWEPNEPGGLISRNMLVSTNKGSIDEAR
jgi:hypothetical protein